jgi:two-component system sensor histidine kinase BaeS
MLAESFNVMAGSLETQERLRKKLMANAAHELRTPLMVIRGELEGMMDGVLPLKKENLQSLHEETIRLATILEGIDELTQAEASFLSLNRQPLLLAPFLVGMAERFGRICADVGVEIKVNCTNEVVALADPDRLSQVMINLISNAIKASSPGGEICISGRRENDETVLEVADKGKGIPAAELPFIFERFYRGRKGGLGLGLAIVRELVQAHGGTVNALSSAEWRTVFTVRLPLQ